MADWQCRNGPDLDPLTALARVAQHDHVVLLDGGPGQPALLQWGIAPQVLTGVEDLPAVTGAADLTTGWPANICGGALVQLDYEFPVGPWALPGPQREPCGRWWPLHGYVTWDAAGQCVIRGPTSAHCKKLFDQLAGDSQAVDKPHLIDPLQPAWDARGHDERVALARAAIARGECYQINLTLPWHGRLAPGRNRDVALFQRLRSTAPGRFAAFLRVGAQTIISHSPECFVRSDGHQVWTEPIKGTRPRLAGQEAQQRADLIAASKDNAELAMIVDLVRNDLGRIAQQGGVAVEAPATVIDLPYVHHLVARVRAALSPEVAVHDVLRAAFPAGSITGAPKIAAMRLIQQLEHGPRGPYCGSIGWIGSGAACSLSVAIRTMVLDGDALRLDAGGGIVADSDGPAEWAEALAKSAPMRAAVGEVAL